MSTASPDPHRARSLASRLALAILPVGALLSALLFTAGNVNTLRARGKALETAREALLSDRAAVLAGEMASLEKAVSAAAAIAFASSPARPAYADAFSFLRALPEAEAVSLVATGSDGPEGILAWRDPPHFRRRPLSRNECADDAFRLAERGAGPVWTRAPRFSALGGETLAVATRAEKADGSVAGLAVAAVPVTPIADRVSRDAPWWAGWLLLARDGTILRTPSDAWAEGENLFLVAEETSDEALAALAKAMSAGESGKRRYRPAGSAAAPRVYRFAPVGRTGFSLALVTPAIEGFWNPLLWPRATVVIFLAGMAVLFLIVFALTKTLTRPFEELSEVARALARGDAADAAAKAEAIGGDAAGKGLRIREYANLADALARTAARETASEAAAKEKAGRLRREAEDLARAASELREAVATRASSARFLALAGAESARRTGELAGKVATAAGAAMSHTTLLAAGGARLAQATAGAEDLRLGAEGLESILGDVAEKAEDLAGTTEGLHSMATNVDLLAVNAAMEGERAGAGGKGFGAIAREIRHLSTRTTETAGRIASGAAELVKAATGAKERLALFLDRLGDGIDEVRSVEQRLASRIDGAKETAETYRGTAEALQRTAGKSKSLAEEGGKILRTSEALADKLEKLEDAAAALRRELE